MKKNLVLVVVALASVFFVSVKPVFAEKLLSAPDAAGIFEESRISKEQVVFEEDFETSDKIKMSDWYAAGVSHKTVFSGVTTEQAFSGKHSYKIQKTFDPVGPSKWAKTYVKLPVQIPVWSDLKLKMYVKIQSQPNIHIDCYHGMGVADVALSYGGSVLLGQKVGEENEWEIWEVTSKRSDSIGQHIEGPALMLTVMENSPATTVTIYVDKITLSGKLPSNWETKWADTYNYYTVGGEKQRREMGARRLRAMTKLSTEIETSIRELSASINAAPILARQYEALMAKAKRDMDAAKPMVKAIEDGLANKDTLFNVNLNKPERLLSMVSHYLDIAAAYRGYAAKYADTDIIAFTLDLTGSYMILPLGPMGHNEELSYYDWNQQPGAAFENPQILPDTMPVIALPSRAMKEFGCRGTYIPFSFAIHTNRELTNLSVTASDLKSKEQCIDNTAVDIRVVAPWYRPFGAKPRLMNEMLLHDPVFVVPDYANQRNIYKDAKFGSDAPVLLPLTIPAGTNRQFYTTVKIPDKAEAGIYHGQVTAKSDDCKVIAWDIELEVLPFDLEPTPYAYSAFYRTYLMDEEHKKQEGINSEHGFQIHRTAAQIEAEMVGMTEHGMNTLNLYDGGPTRTDTGWDFTELSKRLAIAKRAGLTRSPFTWLGHNVPFLNNPGSGSPHTCEELFQDVNERVSAVNAFCLKNGYPRPAFFGHDEASGEALMRLKRGYDAVNKAGGIVTVACYGNYFNEIGTALSLPIVFGGASTLQNEQSIRASQKVGYECWIYNTPATNMPASPSVYRRRYGLAMWRNGENGAAPWEYQGVISYEFNYLNPLYALAFPTWSGKPIDTVIFEGYREGIYDTRYMATLQKYLSEAKKAAKNSVLVAEVEKWLSDFSVNDDLQKVRRQMADYIIALK